MNQARAGDSMTEYFRKDKADKLIDKYNKDIDHLNDLICAERIKAQIKELPNCAALQDKLRKQNKKIKNMRKTVKQQGKSIKRMGAKIAELSNSNVDKEILNFVDWHKFARHEEAEHWKARAWLDDWLKPVEFMAGYGLNRVKDVKLHREAVSFPIYDVPSVYANQIGSFTSSFEDTALIVVEDRHVKEYMVDNKSFLLARVYHNGRQSFGWIPIEAVLLRCLKLQF